MASANRSAAAPSDLDPTVGVESLNAQSPPVSALRRRPEIGDIVSLFRFHTSADTGASTASGRWPIRLLLKRLEDFVGQGIFSGR